MTIVRIQTPFEKRKKEKNIISTCQHKKIERKAIAKHDWSYET